MDFKISKDGVKVNRHLCAITHYPLHITHLSESRIKRIKRLHGFYKQQRWS